MKKYLIALLLCITPLAQAETDFSKSRSRNLIEGENSQTLIWGQSFGKVFRGELVIDQQKNDALIRNTVGLNISAHLFTVGKMNVNVKAGRSSVTEPWLSRIDNNLGVEVEYRKEMNQSYVVSFMNRIDPVRNYAPDVTVTAGVRFYF